ncbi:MAG TPA: hypothetical protein PLS50_09440, partial [Candidatus Dojkabacteria bacterium]|nr:hypothetical protein [Candidatus Dojkabacteria bacterium]
MKNGTTQNTKIKRIPRAKKSWIGFNFNTLSLIIGLFILSSIVMNLFSSQIDAKEVSLSDFIDNVKNNKYSVVEIRDDGKATARGKYIYTLETINIEEINNAVPEDVDYKNTSEGEVVEIDRDKFISLLKPVGFKELVTTTARGERVEAIKNVYIGNEFVLLEN